MELKHHGIRSVSSETETQLSFPKLFAVFVLAIVAVWFVYNYFTRSWMGDAIPYSVVMRMDRETADLVARSKEEPCNLTVANMLATRLINRAEFAAAKSFLNYTDGKCKLDENLMSLLFFAQKGASDFKGAEATANKLLDDHPASADAYQWRYEARKGLGNLQGAYDDLRKVVDLLPDPSRVASWVYYDLAHLAAKVHQPCEAVNTLRDYIIYDPLARRTPQVESLLDKWQKEGNCVSPFGKGSARFTYNRAAPSIILPVTVNGVQTRMIIDTGASRTLLTKEFAQKAGIKPSYQSGALVATVDRVSWQPGGRANEIALGNAISHNVPVFIQASDKHMLGENVGGLLGLSFLGNFKFAMSKGVLELKPLE